MLTEIYIQNLKCGGCAQTIRKGLLALSGIKDVDIDVEGNKVSFMADGDAVIASAKNALTTMGYPEDGENNSVVTRAKSYVSCAIGRINK